QETEIGKVVSNVRKQTEGETSDIARELVRAWKAIAAVDRPSPRPASNGQKAAGESKQAEPKALERGVSTGSDKEPEFEVDKRTRTYCILCTESHLFDWMRSL